MLVVVSKLGDLPELDPDRLIDADAYLAGAVAGRDSTVVNLCRSYRYRTKGYYVSLIADARGQRVLPSVEAIEGLSDHRFTTHSAHRERVTTQRCKQQKSPSDKVTKVHSQARQVLTILTYPETDTPRNSTGPGDNAAHESCLSECCNRGRRGHGPRHCPDRGASRPHRQVV